MKRILILVIAISVMFAVPLTAYAQDVPQERSDCSIEVVVKYGGKNVDGGTLTAVRIGYVDEENGNYFFRQEFTDLRLDDIASADAAVEQQIFYDNNKSNYDFYKQTQSVSEGKAVFSGLRTGLYLIEQKEAAKGFTRMDSFLVSVPYMKNGTYQYHLTAVNKPELERTELEPTVPAPTKPKDPQLPQTGQLNWPIPLMTVAGLTLFAIGWSLCFGKKNEFYEE